MKKSIAIFILAMVMATLPLCAHTIIVLRPELPTTSSSGGRTWDLVPTVYLSMLELDLSFPLATESQVILIDQDTQSVVYSQSFPSTRDLTIDLDEEGIDDGTYTLRVYAFGKWWIGEFELEDSSME